MSFLKFRNQDNKTERGNVHWERAKVDGAPFRVKGDTMPLLKEQEFETFSERVYDCKVGVFNTSDPDLRQNGRTYQEILDGLAASWFNLLSERQYQWGADEKGTPIMYIFVEWSEPFMELSSEIRERIQGN